MRRADWAEVQRASQQAMRGELGTEALQVNRQTTAAAQGADDVLRRLYRGEVPSGVEPVTDSDGNLYFILGLSQLDGGDVLG